MLGSYAIYVNGEERGNWNRSYCTTVFTKIGNNFAGDIAEIVAYDSAMNTSVRQKSRDISVINGA